MIAVSPGRATNAIAVAVAVAVTAAGLADPAGAVEPVEQPHANIQSHSQRRVMPGSMPPARLGPDVDGRSRHPPRDLGQDVLVEDTVRVRCPYCREWIELYVDPDTTGVLVEDCAVCCRPWTVTVERDAGRMRVHVSRAQ